MILSMAQIVLDRMFREEEKLLEKGEAIEATVLLGVMVQLQPSL